MTVEEKARDYTEGTLIVEVVVEEGSDNTYTAYIGGENPLPFGVIGDGGSVEESIEDFKLSFKAMQNYYTNIGKDFPDNVEFAWVADKSKSKSR